ncbi:molybdopterin synthase sulfur carrier subunit [Leifsonia sp. LS1]|uniref:MoaD/ThiS family protein n=1 Tax=unclassified Leifsonia TaxID=2663824 RepID=UPI001CBD5F10|nr:MULTISPECIES: MoaD/ThiS family protein [unclassified Leifsonia]UAJ80901.1 MoaD/ThiS family protein [Leifsonia sp. ZF2019]GIT82039.1 molybdopterin synthase sulfur carrier subunit [Leifsonia sp. LS1]
MADVLVRYFAAAEEAAGCAEERIVLAEPTLGALREELASRHGEPMRRVLRGGSFLVDGVVARDAGRPLGERVDVLPPFAGG